MKTKQAQKLQIFLVRGVSLTITLSSLKLYFSKYGEIKELKFLNQKGGIHKGVARVIFVNPISNTILNENHKINSRQFIVSDEFPNSKQNQNNKPTKPKLLSNKNKLFVGGIPLSVDKLELQRYFEQFGKLEKTSIVLNEELKSRGFGFIIFEDTESMNAVLKIHEDHYIRGKWIDCKKAVNIDKLNKFDNHSLKSIEQHSKRKNKQKKVKNENKQKRKTQIKNIEVNKTSVQLPAHFHNSDQEYLCIKEQESSLSQQEYLGSEDSGKMQFKDEFTQNKYQPVRESNNERRLRDHQNYQKLRFPQFLQPPINPYPITSKRGVYYCNHHTPHSYQQQGYPYQPQYNYPPYHYQYKQNCGVPTASYPYSEYYLQNNNRAQREYLHSQHNYHHNPPPRQNYNPFQDQPISQGQVYSDTAICDLNNGPKQFNSFDYGFTGDVSMPNRQYHCQSYSNNPNLNNREGGYSDGLNSERKHHH